MITTRPLKMLDLCSGLGGASEAFVLAGWDVQRIENNPILAHIPHTTIMDVKTLKNMLKTNPIASPIEFVWASPPCTAFSGGFNSPKSIASRNGTLQQYKPDLDIVKDCKEIIDLIKPKYWCIENVHGAGTYFNPILGKPRQICGAFNLWGNFPLIHIDESKLPKKMDKVISSSNPLRSNLRAQVPLELSEAMLNAIITQKTLF